MARRFQISASGVSGYQFHPVQLPKLGEAVEFISEKDGRKLAELVNVAGAIAIHYHTNEPLHYIASDKAKLSFIYLSADEHQEYTLRDKHIPTKGNAIIFYSEQGKIAEIHNTDNELSIVINTDHQVNLFADLNAESISIQAVAGVSIDAKLDCKNLLLAGTSFTCFQEFILDKLICNLTGTLTLADGTVRIEQTLFLRATQVIQAAPFTVNGQSDVYVGHYHQQNQLKLINSESFTCNTLISEDGLQIQKTKLFHIGIWHVKKNGATPNVVDGDEASQIIIEEWLIHEKTNVQLRNSMAYCLNLSNEGMLSLNDVTMSVVEKFQLLPQSQLQLINSKSNSLSINAGYLNLSAGDITQLGPISISADTLVLRPSQSRLIGCELKAHHLTLGGRLSIEHCQLYFSYLNQEGVVCISNSVCGDLAEAAENTTRVHSISGQLKLINSQVHTNSQVKINSDANVHLEGDQSKLSCDVLVEQGNLSIHDASLTSRQFLQVGSRFIGENAQLFIEKNYTQMAGEQFVYQSSIRTDVMTINGQSEIYHTQVKVKEVFRTLKDAHLRGISNTLTSKHSMLMGKTWLHDSSVTIEDDLKIFSHFHMGKGEQAELKGLADSSIQVTAIGNATLLAPVKSAIKENSLGVVLENYGSLFNAESGLDVEHYRTHPGSTAIHVGSEIKAKSDVELGGTVLIYDGRTNKKAITTTVDAEHDFTTGRLGHIKPWQPAPHFLMNSLWHKLFGVEGGSSIQVKADSVRFNGPSVLSKGTFEGNYFENNHDQQIEELTLHFNYSGQNNGTMTAQKVSLVMPFWYNNHKMIATQSYDSATFAERTGVVETPLGRDTKTLISLSRPVWIPRVGNPLVGINMSNALSVFNNFFPSDEGKQAATLCQGYSLAKSLIEGGWNAISALRAVNWNVPKLLNKTNNYQWVTIFWQGTKIGMSAHDWYTTYTAPTNPTQNNLIAWYKNPKQKFQKLRESISLPKLDELKELSSTAWNFVSSYDLRQINIKSMPWQKLRPLVKTDSEMALFHLDGYGLSFNRMVRAGIQVEDGVHFQLVSNTEALVKFIRFIHADWQGDLKARYALQNGLWFSIHDTRAQTENWIQGPESMTLLGNGQIAGQYWQANGYINGTQCRIIFDNTIELGQNLVMVWSKSNQMQATTMIDRATHVVPTQDDSLVIQAKSYIHSGTYSGNKVELNAEQAKLAGQSHVAILHANISTLSPEQSQELVQGKGELGKAYQVSQQIKVSSPVSYTIDQTFLDSGRGIDIVLEATAVTQASAWNYPSHRIGVRTVNGVQLHHPTNTQSLEVQTQGKLSIKAPQKAVENLTMKADGAIELTDDGLLSEAKQINVEGKGIVIEKGAQIHGKHVGLDAGKEGVVLKNQVIGDDDTAVNSKGKLMLLAEPDYVINAPMDNKPNDIKKGNVYLYLNSSRICYIAQTMEDQRLEGFVDELPQRTTILSLSRFQKALDDPQKYWDSCNSRRGNHVIKANLQQAIRAKHKLNQGKLIGGTGTEHAGTGLSLDIKDLIDIKGPVEVKSNGNNLIHSESWDASPYIVQESKTRFNSKGNRKKTSQQHVSRPQVGTSAGFTQINVDKHSRNVATVFESPLGTSIIAASQELLGVKTAVKIKKRNTKGKMQTNTNESFTPTLITNDGKSTLKATTVLDMSGAEVQGTGELYLFAKNKIILSTPILKHRSEKKELDLQVLVNGIDIIHLSKTVSTTASHLLSNKSLPKERWMAQWKELSAKEELIGLIDQCLSAEDVYQKAIRGCNTSVEAVEFLHTMAKGINQKDLVKQLAKRWNLNEADIRVKLVYKITKRKTESIKAGPSIEQFSIHIETSQLELNNGVNVHCAQATLRVDAVNGKAAKLKHSSDMKQYSGSVGVNAQGVVDVGIGYEENSVHGVCYLNPSIIADQSLLFDHVKQVSGSLILATDEVAGTIEQLELSSHVNREKTKRIKGEINTSLSQLTAYLGTGVNEELTEDGLSRLMARNAQKLHIQKATLTGAKIDAPDAQIDLVIGKSIHIRSHYTGGGVSLNPRELHEMATGQDAAKEKDAMFSKVGVTVDYNRQHDVQHAVVHGARIGATEGKVHTKSADGREQKKKVDFNETVQIPVTTKARAEAAKEEFKESAHMIYKKLGAKNPEPQAQPVAEAKVVDEQPLENPTSVCIIDVEGSRSSTMDECVSQFGEQQILIHAPEPDKELNFVQRQLKNIKSVISEAPLFFLVDTAFQLVKNTVQAPKNVSIFIYGVVVFGTTEVVNSSVEAYNDYKNQHPNSKHSFAEFLKVYGPAILKNTATSAVVGGVSLVAGHGVTGPIKTPMSTVSKMALSTFESATEGAVFTMGSSVVQRGQLPTMDEYVDGITTTVLFNTALTGMAHIPHAIDAGVQKVPKTFTRKPAKMLPEMSMTDMVTRLPVSELQKTIRNMDPKCSAESIFAMTDFLKKHPHQAEALNKGHFLESLPKTAFPYLPPEVIYYPRMVKGVPFFPPAENKSLAKMTIKKAKHEQEGQSTALSP